MSEKVGLALVGCGGIGSAHIAAYKRLLTSGCESFRITACCSRRRSTAEKAAHEIGTFQNIVPEVFDDLGQLVSSGVAQAADVCLPHYLHHSAAIQLLEGGLHVLIEKPVGITLEAGRKIIQASEKHGRILATAENVRRDLPARACVWALTRKKMAGDVLDVDVQVLSYQPFDYSRRGIQWRVIKNLSGGGMILDGGVHFADMMLHMFGEVEQVYCDMRTLDDRIIEDAPLVGTVRADVEDNWHALITFKSGVRVHWAYSRSFPGASSEHGRYYCRDGMMEQARPANVYYNVLHCFQSGGQITLGDGKRISPEQIQREYLNSLSKDEKRRLFPHGVTDGFSIEIWDFIDAIIHNREPEITGHDGQRAKALAECCYESAVKRAPVVFDEVLNGDICTYQQPINEFWEITSSAGTSPAYIKKGEK